MVVHKNWISCSLSQFSFQGFPGDLSGRQPGREIADHKYSEEHIQEVDTPDLNGVCINNKKAFTLPQADDPEFLLYPAKQATQY